MGHSFYESTVSAFRFFVKEEQANTIWKITDLKADQKAGSQIWLENATSGNFPRSNLIDMYINSVILTLVYMPL